MPGCAATFSADTEDELLAQVGPHAADEHGIAEITPDVLEAVKGAIKQE
jgi:predicted small metal-binding protein